MLPQRVRSRVPEAVRDAPRVRSAAVGLGLIPPRSMHSAEEAALLVALARDARRVVEIGVYEGASAGALSRALGPGAELHLIDPFGKQPGALPRGWGATEWASRRVVRRAAPRRGPNVIWHVALSADVARDWRSPVDLVFVDGDHTEPAVELDWDLWHPFVSPGGHVVFHDARLGRPDGRGLPGPTAVVDRRIRNGATPGWAIVAEVDRTVAVRRDG